MVNVVVVGPILYDHILWNRPNMIGRWGAQVARELVYETKAKAPVNKRPKHPGRGQPGDLKRSIRLLNYTRTGPRSREFTIAMNGYARFVIKGTGPVIRSRSGRRMPLPGGTPFDSPRLPTGPDGTQYAQFVSGQRANDFVGRAWGVVAVHHPAIRGKLRYDL